MSNISYGAKSPEARAFHLAVYETVQLIPYGKVTSYGTYIPAKILLLYAQKLILILSTGHIARLIGAPDNSRQVGYALKNLPRAAHGSDINLEDLPKFNDNTVPWWRVINSQGRISLLAHRQHQLVKLREELPVGEDGSVNLGEHGWFPDEV